MRGRLALAALLLAGCRPGTEAPAPASPAPDTFVRARIGAIAQDVGGVTAVVNEVSVQLRPS
jgi:hypothetical protein